MNGGDENQQHFGGQNSGQSFDSTSRAPQEIPIKNTEEITWSASEFIDHQKGSGWFLVLGLVGVVIAAGIFLMTRDWFAPGIILALAVIFGIGGARRPQILEYKLDADGVTIDKKRFAYEDFRSFAIIHEGPIESIILLPVKRWSPPLSIYFDPEDRDLIVNTLSAFVPFEQHDAGYMDRFLHRIRF